MIYLDVACNDSQNGIMEHQASMLALTADDHDQIEFGYKWSSCRAPRFVETKTGFRLAGKSWKTDWSKDRVGNWCWNRYRLSNLKKTHRWYVTDFLIWLKGRNLYSCDWGPCNFVNWFNGGNSLSPADIHGLICELDGLDRETLPIPTDLAEGEEG